MKLKLVSYNIHKGFNFWGTKFVLHELKEGLKELNADFLLLQEVVGENKKFSKKFQNWPTESQMEFLADTVWHHYSYGKNAVFPDRHHGNAILSKYPILRFHNLELTTNRFEQRGLLHCEVMVEPLGKKLHLFNTHLDLLHRNRKSQLRKIIDYIKKETHQDDHAVFAGDFNDWPQLLGADLFDELGFNEGHLHVFNAHARTFPNFFPILCLDRIYFKNISIKEVKTLKEKHFEKLSDHLPISIDFHLNSSS